MLVFNPQHDLCLAAGTPHYVPPQSALRFAQDCPNLHRWIFADAGESAMKDNTRIIPWGWNAVLKEALRRKGTAENLLPSTARLEAIRELSHRSMAAEALKDLSCPDVPVAADSLELIDHSLRQYGQAVLKSPWSGSGKGVFFVKYPLSALEKGRCLRIIRQQGCIMIERFHKIILEGAMLFQIEESGVSFAGHSLFHSRGGVWQGNILASDRYIRRQWLRWIPEIQLNTARANITAFLQKRFAGRYQGIVGVDQYLYEDANAQTHFMPIGEFNVRLTMGLVARRLWDYHRDTVFRGNAVPEGQAKLVLTKSAQEKGIFSLCPITATTQYRALVCL